jgi:hypothetical protein
MYHLKKLPVLILLVASLFTFACVYIVLPEGLEAPGAGSGAGTGVWSAVVTNVRQSDAGDLHIDFTIRNDSGDWSTMRSVPGKPAILTTADGKTVSCDTVFIGTGGHRLAPGFQMRGYTTGTKNDPQIQTLYVECKGVTASSGSKLAINYESFNGILDDYDPGANKVAGTLELNLDEVVTDLTYPVAEPIEGLFQAPGEGIVGLSENVVTLLEVRRTENGFEFDWQNFNPTKFPLKTHIGSPPVIGADGIIYGVYETLDIAEIPLTPPNENAQWTTEVTVPNDINRFYILLSVESKKPRTYINYVLDISEK